MTLFDTKKDAISSVSAFLDLKSRFNYDTSPKWLYRGHADYDHELLPGVGRLAGLSKEKLLKFEESAFADFTINALSYTELRGLDLYILLAIAQHHGLRTRLLDWTLSPLVGLFFAVENPVNFHKDGALISYQPEKAFNTYDRSIQSPFDSKLEEYEFLYVPAISPRINAQHGVFQMFRDPTEPFKEAYNLGKFIIPARYKKAIKGELEGLGITYRTLFPDLDGICKTINYTKLRPLSEF